MALKMNQINDAASMFYGRQSEHIYLLHISLLTTYYSISIHSYFVLCCYFTLKSIASDRKDVSESFRMCGSDVKELTLKDSGA